MYQGVHNVEATPDIPRRLPRGTHGLDPSLVAASQRTRLLEAVGRAVAEKGYAAATIDDIVRGRGRLEEDLLRALQRQARLLPGRVRGGERRAARARARPGAGGRANADWLGCAPDAGIHAYLRWLAAEPALARVFLIEIAAAGPEALELASGCATATPTRMRELQTANGVPDEIFHAVVAGSGRPRRATPARGRRPARAGAGPPVPPGLAAGGLGGRAAAPPARPSWIRAGVPVHREPARRARSSVPP